MSDADLICLFMVSNIYNQPPPGAACRSKACYYGESRQSRLTQGGEEQTEEGQGSQFVLC